MIIPESASLAFAAQVDRPYIHDVAVSDNVVTFELVYGGIAM
jgi:hypothetical protein